MLLKYLFTKKQGILTSRDYQGDLRPVREYHVTHVFEAELPYPLMLNQKVELAPKHIVQIDPSKAILKKSGSVPYAVYELDAFLNKLDVNKSGQIISSTIESRDTFGTDYFITPHDEITAGLEANGLEVKKTLAPSAT